MRRALLAAAALALQPAWADTIDFGDPAFAADFFYVPFTGRSYGPLTTIELLDGARFAADARCVHGCELTSVTWTVDPTVIEGFGPGAARVQIGFFQTAETEPLDEMINRPTRLAYDHVYAYDTTAYAGGGTVTLVFDTPYRFDPAAGNVAISVISSAASGQPMGVLANFDPIASQGLLGSVLYAPAWGDSQPVDGGELLRIGISAVPEPAAAALWLLGLAAVAAAARRRH